MKIKEKEVEMTKEQIQRELTRTVVLNVYNKINEDYDSLTTIVEGNDFNLKDTVNKIELYRASKYKTGDKDGQGNKKYFFNVVNPQCGNATKNIDLDRKNIRCKATDGKDVIKSMIYNAELKDYMRRNNIGLLLNKISEQLPVYGSFVIKKVGKEIIYIPLRKLKFDPSVSNKELNYNIQSPYIMEEHNFQPDGLEQMIDEGWDKEEVEEVCEKFREYRCYEPIGDIRVYEIHAEWRKKDLGLGEKGWVKAAVFYAKGGGKVNKKDMTFNNVLYIKEEKKFPYKKTDYLTIDGRGLGLGLIEMLFDVQQRWNEMANQKAKSMQISSKHIFQTRDKMVESNVISDVLDGDILKVNSEITSIDTTERNLSAYSQEEKNMMDIARSNANAFESVTGESLPSGTPYRLGVMLNQQGGKLFSFIRQNIGLFLEEVFNEWVLPEFDKESIKEHIFQLFDTDTIKLIVERDVNRRVNEAIKKYVLKEANFPTQEEIDMIKEAEMARSSDTEFIKVVEGYLDFDKTIEIDITGEQNDVAAKIETINNLLMLLAQNPTIPENPQTQKLFGKLLEEVGMSPNIIGSAPQGGQPGMQPGLNQMGGLPPETNPGQMGGPTAI